MDYQKQDQQDLEQQAEPQAEKPKPKRSKPDVYKNVTNGVVYVCGHRVQPGMSHEITDVDKKNAIGMKRLEHAVKLGMVEKV